MRFDFNENGVCMNPEKMVDFHDGKNYLIVTVAELADGSWAKGLDMRVETSGYLYSPSIGRERYESDREAVHAALMYVKEMLEEDIKYLEECELNDDLDLVDNSTAIRSRRRMLAAVRDKMEYYDPAQMTLFAHV